MRGIFMIAAVLFVTAGSTGPRSEVIGKTTISGETRYFSSIETEIVLGYDASRWYDGFGFWGPEYIWRNVRLNSNHIDTVLTTEPPPGAIVDWLTDGEYEYFGVLVCTDYACDGKSRPLSYLFSLDTTDFKGWTITSISLKLDDLQFVYDVYRTKFRYTITCVIEGCCNYTPAERSTWGRIKALYTD